MSRLGKLKRQLIEEANKRLLGEYKDWQITYVPQGTMDNSGFRWD